MDEDDIMPGSEGDDLANENEDFIDNPDLEAGPEDAQNHEGEDVQNNEGEEATEATQKRLVKKRVVLNPRPKLDAQRLAGKRGIAILPKLFEGKKFKGKGHEKEDLDVLMSTLEHWGHRLFPLMTFDTLLGAIEKLGSKKAVQVSIKKMRLGMPLLDEDFVTQRDDDDDDKPGTSNQNQENRYDSDQMEPADAFDELLRSNPRNSYSDDPLQDPIPYSTQTPKETATPKMTDEMRERIERNKRIALEKRRQRQLQMESTDNLENTTETRVSNSLDISSTSETESNVQQRLEISGEQESGMSRKTVDAAENNHHKDVIAISEDEEDKCLSEPSTSGVTKSKEWGSKTLPIDLLDEDEFLEEMWGENF